MTNLMLAFCGLDCNKCNAYLAKQNDDDNLRRETAQKWSMPEYPVKVEDINCDGCKPTEGVHFKWCGECAVRGCGLEREVETCAHCADYSCDKVEKMFEMVGEEAKERLETIRKTLKNG